MQIIKFVKNVQKIVENVNIIKEKHYVLNAEGLVYVNIRERTSCKDCGGGSICEHNLKRSQCKNCKGASICEHNKNRSHCKDCDGSQICKHKKFKKCCIECTPDTIYFCKQCRLFRVNNRTNYLCSYCNPDKPDRIKYKELKVKTFLEENNYEFEYNIYCTYQNKGYFPDFKIKSTNGNFWIIIECDELSHNTYNKNDEKIRECNICLALGLPCVFLRYNPDKKGKKPIIKQSILKSYIEYYKNE